MINEQFQIDHDTNRIVFSRDIAASVPALYEAWTRPEKVSQWWDPTGKPLASCEIDLQEGGTFRFVNEGGQDHPFEGQYTRLSPPDQIEFRAMGAEGIVKLEQAGDGTRMTVVMTCSSPEHLQQFVQRGVAQGTSATLENLRRLFATAL